MPKNDQAQHGYLGPLYSDGTAEMDSKKNQGPVEGPKGGLPIPDPLGFQSERRSRR